MTGPVAKIGTSENTSWLILPADALALKLPPLPPTLELN
jgi:hypothetical protein